MMGSIGPSGGLDWLARVFYFLKTINRGGELNATVSINRLTEAGKTTASKKVGLTVTFDRRRL
jgi:hypothetical protein